MNDTSRAAFVGVGVLSAVVGALHFFTDAKSSVFAVIDQSPEERRAKLIKKIADLRARANHPNTPRPEASTSMKIAEALERELQRDFPTRDFSASKVGLSPSDIDAEIIKNAEKEHYASHLSAATEFEKEVLRRNGWYVVPADYSEQFPWRGSSPARLNNYRGYKFSGPTEDAVWRQMKDQFIREGYGSKFSPTSPKARADRQERDDLDRAKQRARQKVQLSTWELKALKTIDDPDFAYSDVDPDAKNWDAAFESLRARGFMNIVRNPKNPNDSLFVLTKKGRDALADHAE